MGLHNETTQGRNVSLEIYQNTTNNDDECTMSVIQGTTLVVINSILVPVGTFGNVLIIFAILSTPQLRQRVSNFLLLSLAVADLLVTMIAQPLFIFKTSFYTFAKRCIPELERAYIGMASLSCSSSVYHLAAISIDRALSIVKPHQHRAVMKKWGLKVLLFICWGAAAFLAIVYTQIHSFALFVTVSFGLSYGIVICSYGTILYKIRCQKVEPVAKTLSTVREKAMHKRISGTIGIVVLLFAVCWMPLIVYDLLHKGTAVDMKYSWIRSLYLSNSSMNFIVYSLRICHFRVAYVRIIHRVLQRLREMLTVSGKPTTKNNTTNILNGSEKGSNQTADITLRNIEDGNDQEKQ